MKKIYNEDGYIDMEYIMAMPETFIFIVSGRGIGKTYGGLKYAKENNVKFIYMRRKQKQVDIIATDAYNPFKSLNEDLGWNVGLLRVSKDTYGFFDITIDKDGRKKAASEPYGYTAALSTFADLRGFDASDIDLLFYDEFIPELHEAKIKHGATAFFNAVETINRNRELKGKPPLKCLLASNANDLGNELFMELGLVTIAENMKKAKQECYVDPERSLRIYILDVTPIGEKKKKTALYKLTKGTEFANMATSNEFIGVEKSRIGSRPLKEYVPIVNAGVITIYKHKSNNEYYCCQVDSKTVETYGEGKIDKTRFRKNYSNLLRAYLKNRIVFEKYIDELFFRRMFDI